MKVAILHLCYIILNLWNLTMPFRLQCMITHKTDPCTCIVTVTLAHNSMHAHLCTHMCSHTLTGVHTMYTCKSICILTWKYKFMHMHTQPHTHLCIDAHSAAHIHAVTCMHTHFCMHTHMHAATQSSAGAWHMHTHSDTFLHAWQIYQCVPMGYHGKYLKNCIK